MDSIEQIRHQQQQQLLQQQRRSRREVFCVDGVSRQKQAGSTTLTHVDEEGRGTIPNDDERAINGFDDSSHAERRPPVASSTSHQPQTAKKPTPVEASNETAPQSATVDRKSSGCSAKSLSSGATIDDESTVDAMHDPPWNGYDNIAELKEAIVASAAAKMAAVGSVGSRRAMRAARAANTTSSSSARTASDFSGSTTRDSKTASTTAAHGQQAATGDDEVGAGRLTSKSSNNVVDQRDVPEGMTQHTDTGPVAVDKRNDKSSTRPLGEGESLTKSAVPDGSRTSSSSVAVAVDETTIGQDSSSTGKRKKNVSFDDDDDKMAPKSETDKCKGANGRKAEGASKTSSSSSSSRFGRKTKSSEKPPMGKTDKSSKKNSEKNNSTPADSPKKLKSVADKKKDKEKTPDVPVTPPTSGNGDKAAAAGKHPEARGDGGGKMSFFRSILTRSRSPSPKRGRAPLGGNGDHSPSKPMTSSTAITRRSPSPASLAKRLSDPLRVSLRQIMSESGKKIDDKKPTVPPEKPKRLHQLNGSESEENGDIVARTTDSADGRTTVVGETERTMLQSPAAATCQPPGVDVGAVNGGADGKVGEMEQSSNSGDSVRSTADSGVDVEFSSNATDAELKCGNGDRADGTAWFAEVPDNSNVTSERADSPSTSLNTSKQTDARSSAGESDSTESTASNPWVVNLKELNITTPNLENFRGEKVFQKGTATTSVTLKGFERLRDGGAEFGNELGGPERDQNQSAAASSTARNSSPIYDAVYVERSAVDTSLASASKSSAELDRFQASRRSLGASSSRSLASDASKAASLQSLKKPENAAAQISTPNAITKRLERGDGGCDDRRAVDRTGQKASTNETDEARSATWNKSSASAEADGRVGTSSSSSGGRLFRHHQPLTVSKSSSLPRQCSTTQQLPSTAPAVLERSVRTDSKDNWKPNGFVEDADVEERSRRDTLTSLIGLDEELSASQRDLADQYRAQKSERQKEQETAQRERERWEKIERL